MRLHGDNADDDPVHTFRDDLCALDEKEQIEEVYGGVCSVESSEWDVSFTDVSLLLALLFLLFQFFRR